LILPEHHPVVAHLVLAGGEVTVPEKRELLLEGALARQHPVGPPEAEPLRLDVVGGQAVEELVDDRLEAARRPFWEHFFAESLAMLARNPHGLGTAWRKWIHARVPDCRLVERWLTAIVNRVVVDQSVDGALRRHRSEPLDLFGRRAEAARSSRCAARS
jgi:hypothetical protein